MISRDWKVVFVHQRKSAGTSVKDLFPPVEGPDRGRFNNGLLDPTWDDPEFAGYYRFTVVRNPWDRFVSAWNYCRSTRGRPILDVIENLPMPDIRDNVLARRQSLRARLRYALELAKLARDGKATPMGRGHDYRHIARQQWESVVRPDGSLAVDRVVFFEDLAAGLAQVFADIGRPMPALPGHKVKRAGDDYRRHFDAPARAAFARVFARDIETWGYDFDTGRASRVPPRAPQPSSSSVERSSA